MTNSKELLEASEAYSNIKYGNYSDTVINAFLAGAEFERGLLSAKLEALESLLSAEKAKVEKLQAELPMYHWPQYAIRQHYEKKFKALEQNLADYEKELTDINKSLAWYRDVFGGWETNSHEFEHFWRVELPSQIESVLEKWKAKI
jgi:hypothetical protein